MPWCERECINNYKMMFLDRNAISKSREDNESARFNYADEELKIPIDISEASPDYECTLSDVIGYLKKCGYPLENCFISFFSPIFSAYINCGLDPLPTSIKITSEDLTLIQDVNH